MERYKNIIGSIVTGTVDRPLGTAHPDYPDMIYPINYGYVGGIFAADGEEQDVYIFGTDEPIETFTGKVIAVYHRTNDTEDKWIVSVDGKDYTDEEILKLIEFQEKYYEGHLIRQNLDWKEYDTTRRGEWKKCMGAIEAFCGGFSAGVCGQQ